ncbi:hypothetical protein AHiyo4_32060 [Arthrobacter sp. Hiyo4]|nr:hypothetical protein AHiyo4_32060 [Arthrobacter sp. Hiyo4]
MRLGVPGPAAATTSMVVLATILAATSAGLRAGLTESRAAAAPTTCGTDMEVPDMVRVAVDEVCPAETMPTPGA